MAKIIQIQNDVITIGKEDGSITEVRRCDLNFTPFVNDMVDIFQNEERTIVSKKETPQQELNSGININVNNSNTNTNDGVSYVANGKKAVNKVVYCIIVFFLGSIGIHKFYTGRIGSGILFLVFCWTGIPSIIALIEFIMALVQKSDQNGMILV